MEDDTLFLAKLLPEMELVIGRLEVDDVGPADCLGALTGTKVFADCVVSSEFL